MAEGLLDLDSASFDEVVKQGKVLVDFWAPWCGPCKMQTPILEKVKGAIGEAAVIAKVNVDENPDLAAKFSVRSIPTLLLLEDGELKETMVGLKQQAELVELLNG
ncbi:MAG: thioredoxin [Kiritimatiellaceae bacterium]|nr:MAG: thioredoxin [Kiritimatiellaceae bacterium]|tara:strand:- start:3535 stop:3849 length:315 start_codon:yes stop_codon:yes gene_type:complete